MNSEEGNASYSDETSDSDLGPDPDTGCLLVAAKELVVNEEHDAEMSRVVWEIIEARYSQVLMERNDMEESVARKEARKMRATLVQDVRKFQDCLAARLGRKKVDLMNMSPLQLLSLWFTVLTSGPDDSKMNSRTTTLLKICIALHSNGFVVGDKGGLVMARWEK